MRAGSRRNCGRRAVHSDKDSSERRVSEIEGERAEGIPERVAVV